MKRIKFHDESGQYEVHIIPFIFKTIFCVFGLIIMIGIAIELPSSIRYDLKYSGKEYNLTNCERITSTESMTNYIVHCTYTTCMMILMGSIGRL